MDELEFEKHSMGSIVPLFLAVEYVVGKRVMVEVDSGPGFMNPQLLAKLDCSCWELCCILGSPTPQR